MHKKNTLKLKRLPRKVVYTCKLPVNTTATVTLPDGSRKEVGSGKWEFTFEC